MVGQTPGAGAVRPRRRRRAGRRQRLGRQRPQDRTRPPHRRPRPGAGRRRHAGADAGASRLSLRRPRPCLTPSASPPASARTPASPITRRDGIAKVTGTATFAADNHPDGLLYAVYVPATIARGRVTHLDVAAAKAHPGVVEVYHARQPPAAGRRSRRRSPSCSPSAFEALQDDTVRYANQPIALVLGETHRGRDRRRAAAEPAIRGAAAARRAGRRRALQDRRSAPSARPGETVHGDIAAGHAAAAAGGRRDLRDARAVSQRDGDPCRRRRNGTATA